MACFLRIYFILGFLILSQAVEARRDSTVNRLIDKIIKQDPRTQTEQMLKDCHELINYTQEKGYVVEEVRAYSFLAEAHRSIASLDQALKTINEIEDKVSKLDNNVVKSFYYNRKAAIIFELKQLDEAKRLAQISIKIDSIRNKASFVISNLNIIGAVYRDQGKFGKANHAFKEIMNRAHIQKDTNEYYNAVYNLVNSYSKLEMYDSAYKYIWKYRRYEKGMPDLFFSNEILHILAQTLYGRGAADSAYLVLDTVHERRLSELQEITDKRANEAKMRSELERKELENSILKVKQKQNKLQSYLLVAGIAISLLIMLFVYKQKATLQKLHIKQQELNEELESSLEFKNKLIAIIAHDIRNPMNALRGLINLYNQGYIESDEMNKMMSKLGTSANQVNLLLENLLGWAMAQKGKIEVKKTKVNLRKSADKVMAELDTLINEKQLKIDLSGINKKDEIVFDKNLWGLVIRNIFTNAIKFSHEEGVIKFYKTEREGKTELIIEDEGIGIPKSELENIFNEEKANRSSEGTSSEKGTGLGLPLCKEFVEANDYKIELESEEGKGTKVKIIIE